MNGQQQVDYRRVAGRNKGPSRLKQGYNTHIKHGFRKQKSLDLNIVFVFRSEKTSDIWFTDGEFEFILFTTDGSLAACRRPVVLKRATKVTPDSLSLLLIKPENKRLKWRQQKLWTKLVLYTLKSG